MSLIRMIK